MHQRYRIQKCIRNCIHSITASVSGGAVAAIPGKGVVVTAAGTMGLS